MARDKLFTDFHYTPGDITGGHSHQFVSPVLVLSLHFRTMSDRGQTSVTRPKGHSPLGEFYSRSHTN